MITISSLSVSFGKTPIISRLSLSVERSDKVALCGESGSGKSTLIKTLVGMHLPVEGHIAVVGLPLVPANLRTIRKSVFYLPQDIVPQGEESVRDYLRYPFQLAINRGLEFSPGKVNDLFGKMRLEHSLLDQPFYKLSGGERRRIGLMRGFLLERPVLLLDEPTAGIDAENRDEIIRLLISAPQTTMLAVTHDEQLIERCSKKVVMQKTAPAGGSR